MKKCLTYLHYQKYWCFCSAQWYLVAQSRNQKLNGLKEINNNLILFTKLLLEQKQLLNAVYGKTFHSHSNFLLLYPIIKMENVLALEELYVAQN